MSIPMGFILLSITQALIFVGGALFAGGLLTGYIKWGRK